MASRLKWERSDIEGWLTAHPIEGDDWTVAHIYPTKGRPIGAPSWLWNIRYDGDKVVNGAAHSKQEASDQANYAWGEIQTKK